MERKWWALIVLVLVLVIVISVILIVTKDTTMPEEELEGWGEDFLYGEWYVQEISEEGDWIMYNPELEESQNFNVTWVLEGKTKEGKNIYMDPHTEEKIFI